MVIARILKWVVTLAVKVEVVSLFHAAQEIVPLRTTVDELRPKQPATPLQTNNNSASGIMNGTIRQQRSKAIDIIFYWLKDRVTQQMFKVYWPPGKVNLADYFLKYHPVSHVKKVRKLYVNEPDSPRIISACNKNIGSMSSLQVCVKTLVNSDITPACHTDSNCGRTVRLAYLIQAGRANHSNTDTVIRIPSKPEYRYVRTSTKRCEE